MESIRRFGSKLGCEYWKGSHWSTTYWFLEYGCRVYL
jgi:hypothetical protein